MEVLQYCLLILLVIYHKEKDADITIAVVPVLCKDASRFGILNTDEKMRVTEFQEKPESPKSHLASMGIYIEGLAENPL